jgi:aerobic-type carbon monoxide dehydrogenase small subunit (CoxS/CutS family)
MGALRMTTPGAREIDLTVNGERIRVTIEPRLLLSDLIRRRLRLTGTHVGCEHGVCGACTVIVDGEAVRSCLMLAVQADGREVRTVESVAPPGADLHPVQQALHDCHGLQCGFCTPGIVMSLVNLAERGASLDDGELVDELSGHVCRCTGYRNILQAARRVIPAPPADGESDR